MFLRNYDNYWAASQLVTSGISSSYGSNAEFGDGFINQKVSNSAIQTVALCSNYGYFHGPFSISAAGICLGDGDVPVTYDDYNLSGNIITNNLVQESSTRIFDADTKKYTHTLICTYYNSTEAPITIKEWGLFRTNSGTSTSATFSNNSSSLVLTYREVLVEPIVIAAGETATINFSIEIPACMN